MIPISSVLESKEEHFTEMKELLETQQFTLGGNWDTMEVHLTDHLMRNIRCGCGFRSRLLTGHIDNEAADDECHR